SDLWAVRYLRIVMILQMVIMISILVPSRQMLMRNRLLEDLLIVQLVYQSKGKITLTLGIAKSGEGEGEFGDFDFDIEWVKVDGKEPIAEEDGGTVTYYTYELD